ncbi:MAG: hypothetical protein PHQ43_01555 [Dehalococcoidales bacterium]|nr:hypothetical protein [Dehalococcoidales bacterium]
MASKEQILGILAGASAPTSRVEIEKKVGESYRRFQTQLDRWVKQELIEDVGDHRYVLTDQGRDESLQEEFDDIPDETASSPPGEKKEDTQATAGTTEYQQFLKLGKYVGVVPMSLIKVTTDHVWNGGDYQDLKWVAQALQEMGIQRDLANRWFNSWRSHLKLALPADLPHDFLPAEARKGEEKAEAEKKQGAGKRDYILDEDDSPQWVGDGNGNLDYKDALDLAKIRAARRKDGNGSSPGSMADEVTKIFRAFKETMGEKTEGKSYVVKPGENGYQVEEVEPGKPLMIPQPEHAKPTPSFFVDNDGQVKEIQPGQPVVIMKDAPRPPQSSQQYLIDQRTGEVREVAAGQPIIIKTESAPVSQATPIQIKDKDGNPMVLDLSTFIRLEEHKEKMRRDEESHQMKVDIAKGFKDLLKHAQSAMSHMGEEEE